MAIDCKYFQCTLEIPDGGEAVCVCVVCACTPAGVCACMWVCVCSLMVSEPEGAEDGELEKELLSVALPTSKG